MSLSIQSVMDIAKQNLLQDGHLSPVTICVTPQGIKVIPAQFRNDGEKHAFYTAVGAACRDFGTTRIFLVNDAALRILDKKDFPVEGYLDPTETPLTYPKSMRTEVIVVLDHDFSSKKTDYLFQPYTDTDNKIEFITSDQIPSDMTIEGALIDCVEEGYTLNLPEAP